MRAPRLLALLTLTLSGALWSASCRDVVSGEDTRQVVQELCDTLERCYGDAYSCEVILARFGRAEGPDQDFLEAFDEGCTESCPGARDCLDRSPICGDAGADCGTTAGCCDTGLGLLRCAPPASGVLDAQGGGECCIPDGVGCDGRPDDCCSSCVVVGDASFCGGFECTREDEPCRSSLECCSRFCDPESKTCERRVCSPIGEACLTTADCCPPDVQSNVLPPTIACLDTGVCGYPPNTKALAGSPCLVGDDCESGLCFPVEGSDERRCAGGDGCLPELVDCQSDGDCCQGGEPGVPEGATPLLCNLSAKTPRCEPNYTCSEPTGCCAIAGAPCESDEACCSNQCGPGGQCVASSAPTCATPGCHGLCQEGAPMLPAVGGDPAELCPGELGRAACIALVVAADDFCECYQWDQVCVALARDLCADPSEDPCGL